MARKTAAPRTTTDADGGATVAATGVGVTQPASGWDEGNVAPKNQYAPLNADGSADLDHISSKPVEGRGVQLAVKGQPVTRAVLIGLGRLDPRSGVPLVRTPVAEPQGEGQTEPPSGDGS